MNPRTATTTARLRHEDRSSSQRTFLTESLPDEELLERVGVDRDEVAFGVLYARYARAVFALVVRVLRGDPASDDAAQKAFTAVWRGAGGYHRGRGNAVDWMFAVARAAGFASRVVILDDPTAALGLRESRSVLDLIDRLRRDDHAVIVISHAMDHVIEIADRAVVMRRGRKVGEESVLRGNQQRIVSLIVGGEG